MTDSHRTPEEHRLTELASGVRIVTEAMPSVRSAALGFWIGAGSVGESETEAGLSHLVEHLLFRGSAKFSSLEIDEIFDTMGAEINAGTGKESTSVYSRVLDRHLPRAFEVMADMVWHPSIDDVDPERAVILEEIAMYEDDPQDKVFDVLGEAVFGGHPLGRSVIGRAEVVSQTPPEAITDFHSLRYGPRNVVIAAAGSVDHDALVAQAIELVPDAGAAPPAAIATPDLAAPRTRFEAKDTEQYHVCLGAPGLARDDDRRFALRVLDNIFGGTSSSRLFQEVRERRGLAYSVFSFSSAFAGTGQVGLYVGTRAEKLGEALRVVGEQLERMQAQPASASELERSKENVKGRLVLSLESTGSRMSRLGSSILTEMPLLTVDELIDRIDAVTIADLRELATELFAPAMMSAAGIGPDESLFQSALEPIHPNFAKAA